jgi:DNA-binding beta-propeller fold protein YncE
MTSDGLLEGGGRRFRWVSSWGSATPGVELGEVSGVAITDSDLAVVVHRRAPHVLIYDLDGKLLQAWTHEYLADPHGVSMTPQGQVSIVDRQNHVVLEFSLEGELLFEIGHRGEASDTGCDEDGGEVPRPGGPFNRPTKSVSSTRGRRYVSDGYRNSRVHRFSADGQLEASWGEYGSAEPGQLRLPHSVLVDESENVYVCDRENNRIVQFDQGGAVRSEWSGLHRPTDLARGADGIFYVSELSARISFRNSTGEPVGQLPAPPSAHGLAVDQSGSLYIAQVRGRRISKYVREG